jgi:hypothetical protein
MASHSMAERLRDWDVLLKAVEESAAELPGHERYKAHLQQALEEAVSSRSRRDALLSSVREATFQTNEAVEACAEAASALRSFIKSVHGFRSEKLSRYGIRPFRKRGATFGRELQSGELNQADPGPVAEVAGLLPRGSLRSSAGLSSEAAYPSSLATFDVDTKGA